MPEAIRIVVISPDLAIADPQDSHAREQDERSRSLRIGLLESGFNLVASLPADVFLTERLAQLRPDLVIVDAESDARDSPCACNAWVQIRGKVVCTCLQVRDIAIEDNLPNCTGTASERLAKLQGALQCGTQCGSCVPELQRMVRSSASLPDAPAIALQAT